MGAIDLAFDRALDRRVALKTLHPHLRASESAVRMFLREARLTGLLDHPHIVPIYDVGERDSDDLYFAMKWVEGGTLADLLRELPRGPLETATLYALLDIVTKVCDALSFAHSRGVLHCDVKPSNVMVGEFGEVYLMDWGIARLLASERAADVPPNPPTLALLARGQTPTPRQNPGSATDDAVLGTPCYMSPEQARGERATLDVRSDVFLIGSLLYEILARRPPYASLDRAETLKLALAGVFPPPREVAPEADVPPELERIVLRAMASDLRERYPSVSALREDLTRMIRGGGDFPRKAFEAGEAIVREGDRGDAAYIVVAGRCDIQKATPSGPEILMSVGPGAVFGEMAILTLGPRTATVVATEPTTVLVVTSATLDREMQALKPWIATLLKSLATRFRESDTKQREAFGTPFSPTQVAHQLFMTIVAWGVADDSGGMSMAWSALSQQVDRQFGALSPTAKAMVPAVAKTFGFQRVHEGLAGDSLTIANVAALRTQLSSALAP